ncbi:PHO85 cyclin-1 [Coemansia erecta]|uniref:PHO85 cyclin-1 n=1 Tax=Coemansia asiatica TaxID=1052880 RepID=A0A9W8CM78_9FUNG|nr:PHO85 cyclin-1 [Coemansia asiatica]KAJ2854079.1 PHO85 cyclin-1 [Coemansia erecta]KAJ2870331.1 PHO85 cyclin-1 [Coemansia asiatica]
MLSAIAPAPGAQLQLFNPASGVQSQQLLMRTAACSLKSLLRTVDSCGQQPAFDVAAEPVSSLRGNFSHMMPKAAAAAAAPQSIIMASTSRLMLPPIEVFVRSVTSTLNTKAAVLVTALIYVERLGKRLPRSATGAPDTPYRVFLAALMLADKFWSDHSVAAKNLVAAAGGAFGQREIAAMERAMLKLLGFNLYVSADHIRQHARKIGMNTETLDKDPAGSLL